MKIILCAVLASTLLGAVPTLALAEDAAAPAAAAASEPPPSPLSFNIGAVSEYRYRGISQTRFQPAVQGGIDYAFASGLYVGTWMSNIRWIKDAGTIAGVDVGTAPVEWDFYGGYKGEIVKDLSYDVGALVYYYPSQHSGAIPGAKNADTAEIYGALTYGPATVKYSHAVTTLFGFAGSTNSGYLEAAASFDLGQGWGIAPHVGYQHVSGSNNGVSNDTYTYTDYSLTGTKDFGNGLTISLAAVGTSTKSVPGSYAYVSPDGKNLGRATAVLGVKYTF